VLATGALILIGTVAPTTLFAVAQSRVPADVAGAFLNLEPLVGAVAGTLLFADPLGALQLTGGGAILAGISLSSLHAMRTSRTESPAGPGAAGPAAAGTVTAGNPLAGTVAAEAVARGTRGLRVDGRPRVLGGVRVASSPRIATGRSPSSRARSARRADRRITKAPAGQARRIRRDRARPADGRPPPRAFHRFETDLRTIWPSLLR
jgi:EamA-like transporter family